MRENCLDGVGEVRKRGGISGNTQHIMTVSCETGNKTRK